MTWNEEQLKLKENHIISCVDNDNSYNSLLKISESLNISLDEAYDFYIEKIGNISSVEKSKAKLKQVASKLPIAGYIDKDGATVLPSSWREE